MSDSIVSVSCTYFPDGSYNGFRLVYTVTTKKTDEEGMPAWGKAVAFFYSPVLDFLNRDYNSLASGTTNFVYSTTPPIPHATRNQLVADDLALLERTSIRDMIDRVLLFDIKCREFNCAIKWAAYFSVNTVAKKTTNLLDHTSFTQITGSVVDKTSLILCPEEDSEDESQNNMEERHPLNDPDFYETCEIMRAADYLLEPMISKDFFSMSDMIRFLILEMIKQNVSVKKCQNCGKYFVPYRYDALFCDNASPQDNKKTCQEYGKYANFLEKTRTDEATRLYKQIYNAKNNKARRCKTECNPEGNPTLNADLETFVSQAAKYRSNIKCGAISEDEYIAWLRDVKEGKKF